MNRIAKNVHRGYWKFRIRMLTRALPTKIRLVEAGSIESARPCFLCGIGRDDVSHIYFDCPATRHALSCISGSIGARIEAIPAHLLLIRPPPLYTSLPLLRSFLTGLFGIRGNTTTKALLPPPPDCCYCQPYCRRYSLSLSLSSNARGGGKAVTGI